MSVYNGYLFKDENSTSSRGHIHSELTERFFRSYCRSFANFPSCTSSSPYLLPSYSLTRRREETVSKGYERCERRTGLPGWLSLIAGRRKTSVMSRLASPRLVSSRLVSHRHDSSRLVSSRSQSNSTRRDYNEQHEWIHFFSLFLFCVPSYRSARNAHDT